MRVQSPPPKAMKVHLFEMSWNFSPEKCLVVWNKLQLRETFVKGQIPPYKVEFETDYQFGPFQTGELNIHHGPLLSVHGAVGEITENYRDLQYFYGSYILSFRFIRPIRLEFFKLDSSIKVRLTSYVAPWAEPIWNAGLKFFWGTFGITF